MRPANGPLVEVGFPVHGTGRGNSIPKVCGYTELLAHSTPQPLKQNQKVMKDIINL